MTHTPGPWIVDRSLIFTCVRTGDADELGKMIATVHRLDDARLIAAAPAMFTAIETVVSLLSGIVDDAECDHEANVCWCTEKAALGQIRAIIAKAKGGAQ